MLLFCVTLNAQHDCSTAVVYEPGTEEMPLNYVEGTNNYWFSYTAPESSAVTVTLCNNNVSLNIYSDCDNSVYVPVANSYCDRENYLGRVVTFQIPEGETYYINVYTYAVINEPLKISAIPMSLNGATCDDAKVLIDGLNVIPANRTNYNYTTWATYIPEITGILKLTVTDLNYFPSSYIHIDCDDIEGEYASSNGAVLKINAEKDVPVFLRILNQSVFTVNVSCEEIVPGSDCDMPVAAIVGENLCNGTIVGNHWYSFTPDFSGYIEINACNFESLLDVNAYLYTNCSGGYVKQSTYCPESGVGFYLRYKVDQGREYKFNIITQNEIDDFNFTVAQSPALPGEECTTAIELAEGNHVHPGNFKEYWYSYEATGNNYLEISSCGASNVQGYFTIYTNCTSWVASSTSCQSGGSYSKFIVSEGKTYYIKWMLNNESDPFTFSINELPIMPGDVCDNPIHAVYGENTIEPASVSRTTYFDYTATETGWLSVSICDPGWYGGSITLRESCTTIASNYQFSTCASGIGAIYKFPVQKNQNYIIEIYNTSILNSAVSFTIDEVEFEEGDVCDNPILVDDITQEIVLEKTQGIIWYKFTTDNMGYFTISSNNMPSSSTGSSIQIKKGDCSESSTYASYDYSTNSYSGSVIAPAYTDIFVCVTLNTQTSGVSWKVDSRDVIDGEDCGKPILMSGTFDTPNLSGQQIWYVYTAPDNGNLTFTTCGSNVSPRMELYKDCASREIIYSQYCSDYTGTYLNYSVEKDHTYFLCLRSVYGIYTINVDFENTGTGINEQINNNKLLVEPNPNDGYFRIHFDNFSEKHPVMVDIINMQGQLVYRQQVQQGTLVYVVDKRDLPAGIYNLILTGNSDRVVRKFIVVD